MNLTGLATTSSILFQILGSSPTNARNAFLAGLMNLFTIQSSVVLNGWIMYLLSRLAIGWNTCCHIQFHAAASAFLMLFHTATVKVLTLFHAVVTQFDMFFSAPVNTFSMCPQICLKKLKVLFQALTVFV